MRSSNTASFPIIGVNSLIATYDIVFSPIDTKWFHHFYMNQVQKMYRAKLKKLTF